MLSGGDRRSIGRVDEVIEFAARNPRKISALIDCLWDKDPIVRMRAADALEKISREQPSVLQSRKDDLLALANESTQQEVRWHLAVVLPRLQLIGAESRRIAGILQTYLEDRSSIVKTFAMQGLVDLTNQNASLRPTVIEVLRMATRNGTPAMRARGRKLLAQLGD
jgi:HEAT repeat protein